MPIELFYVILLVENGVHFVHGLISGVSRVSSSHGSWLVTSIAYVFLVSEVEWKIDHTLSGVEVLFLVGKSQIGMGLFALNNVNQPFF